ncbi:ABC transporter ATP-binding protein [Paenibacillus aurantius]|uniref:ABC transporter ATP-binding protein n=1 Tax=Paenibacillus aurantius TaxID=2918900 RepID=A0AA96LFD2_9BACL|nr:ABC transporter ATP-binding protein [Paenibacillus aurantius]WNQ11086.1 ABC transporter ATP-binding protein [Paenibacillus aurantius]
MNPVVEVRHLTKTYGKIDAVKDVSFKLEEGKIYGLLGRNGAGKTTIMHMLTAQLFATSGELKVFGQAPYENEEVLRRLCFIKESQRYPDIFRIVDVLESAASFFPNWDRAYAYALVEDFRLPLDRWMKKLSRGMLSAVGVIIGLASRAPLTFFDEPYLGLDAVTRALFYDRLREDYTEHPRTIVLSTHLIDEVSPLLEHVLVIRDGRLIVDEDADNLRGRAVTVMGPAAGVEAFATGKEVMDRQAFGGMLTMTVMAPGGEAVRRQAKELGLELSPVSLQQLIVRLTESPTPAKAVKTL